jgi:hypothetical protein
MLACMQRLRSKKMTTPAKDLPDKWRKRFQGKDLTETDECMDAALRIAATELG